MTSMMTSLVMQSEPNSPENRGMDLMQPSRKRLASVESERIIAVLDLTIRKIEIVALLSSITSGEQRAMFDEPTMAAVHDFARAKHSFENGASDLKEVEFEMLADQTRTTARAILNDPSPPLQCQSFPPAVELMHRTVCELKAALFRKLLTTADEEDRKQKYLSSIDVQMAKSNNQIDRLEQELDELLEQRDDEVTKRQNMIAKLTNDLVNVVSHGEEVAVKIERDAQGKISMDASELDHTKDELSGQLEELEKRLEKLRADNSVEETKLRAKKFKIEGAISRKVAEYDKDMSDKQEKIDRIEKAYTVEQKQLSDLQERFEVLEKEYNEIVAQQKVDNARRDDIAEKHTASTKAAITIQKSWRSYQSKKAASKKSSKKGKGKGKKSSKKKKKK